MIHQGTKVQPDDAGVRQVDAWLGEIGAGLGLSLGLDEDGACAVTCGDGLVVSVVVPELSDSVLLHAHLGPPSGPPEAFFRGLLARNHLFAGSGGCTLAFDETENQAALCQALPLALTDRARFVNSFGHFIDTAIALAQELRSAGAATAPVADSAAMAPFAHFANRA